MGHTNSTTNYNLPQFVGTDKPSWLGDINDAFSAIDLAIAEAATEATSADAKADALEVTVGGHTTQIGALQGTVTSQGNTLNTVTSLIGNGTPTTTDQTIIGAINELNAKEGDLADLQTTDKSSLVAAINEVATPGGTVDLSWHYLNSATGTTPISIPTEYHELLVLIKSGIYRATFLIPSVINDSFSTATAGGVTLTVGECAITKSVSTVVISSVSVAGADVTSTATIDVYYR